ncbi:unnamed protein product [Moneuplotes crassus]|uniref:Uncharacterized protein n=1 Tax=Euplotes crassus TaxID=5936 RepID=A0AAD2D5Y1_EUPCR|nr:unnamed protein product [Moneuplotes crassus]
MDPYFGCQKKVKEKKEEDTFLFEILKNLNLTIVIGIFVALFVYWDNAFIRDHTAKPVLISMVPSILFQIYPTIRFNIVFRVIVTGFMIFSVGVFVLIAYAISQTETIIEATLVIMLFTMLFMPSFFINLILYIALNMQISKTEMKQFVMPQESIQVQPLMI